MTGELVFNRVQEGAVINDNKIFFLPICDSLANRYPSTDARAIAISEDGYILAHHTSESLGWLRVELGVDAGASGYRGRYRTNYEAHYPDGYKLVDLSSTDLPGTPYVANATPRTQAIHLLRRDSYAHAAYEKFLERKSVNEPDPLDPIYNNAPTRR